MLGNSPVHPRTGCDRPVRQGLFGRETGAAGKKEVTPALFFCAPERLHFLAVLFDLELAQDGVPGDVNLVPLGFQAPERAFAHFAEVTQRRRIADERMDFVARGRGDFNGGVNQLNLLHNDAFDFEEMALLRRPELLSARDVDEMVELFPALDVRFDLGDQLVEFFGSHKCGAVVVGEKSACGKRKMLAPPPNSRGGMRRLAKWRLISASGIWA